MSTKKKAEIRAGISRSTIRPTCWSTYSLDITKTLHNHSYIIYGFNLDIWFLPLSQTRPKIKFGMITFFANEKNRENFAIKLKAFFLV
jgi:hypothetical protein